MLAMRDPATEDALAILVNDCGELSQVIQLTPALHGVPEAIWHFLSDADIRFKDPRYAVMQLEGLRLARQVGARDRGLTIRSSGPLRRVAVLSCRGQQRPLNSGVSPRV